MIVASIEEGLVGVRVRWGLWGLATVLTVSVLGAFVPQAGAVIVYDCAYNLCRVNADGSNQVQLTTDGSASNEYVGPSLSGDGSVLSFALENTGAAGGIYVANGSAENRAGPLGQRGRSPGRSSAPMARPSSPRRPTTLVASSGSTPASPP